MRWERVMGERGGGPGKRWGHTCNAIRGGKLVYVFGGYGPHHSQTNQVHVFDSDTQTWSEPVIKGTAPIPRDSHTCSTVEDNLFVFGGTDGLNPLRDLHVLDTSSNTWISPNMRGDGPEAREGHSAAVVGKRLFVFGGCGKSTNNAVEVHYNDLYILDTESFVWQRAVTSGIPPAARDSHSCSSWKNKIIVIGGEDEHDFYLSDVHILDTDTFVWKELNTSGQVLTPRAGHSSVAFGKYIFVFGGFTDAQNLYDDLYMLEIDTGIWAKVMHDGDGPSARFSMSGDCLDPSKDGVLLFIGGCNKYLEAQDDMYYFHTELERDDGRDERRLEELSLRTPLNIQSQEQYSPYSESDKAIVTFGTADLSTYNSQQSRQYFHLNMYRPPIGKRTFQAKVTKNFANGFTIETVIDGKPLRGILFSTSSANMHPDGKKDADSVIRSSTYQDPPTEPASDMVVKNTQHPNMGQAEEVSIIYSDNIMGSNPDFGVDKADRAASVNLGISENSTDVANGSAALPSSQEGQVLTSDRT